MFKRTQTIRGQWPTICLSVFDHFVGWRLKGSNDLDRFGITRIFLSGLRLDDTPYLVLKEKKGKSKTRCKNAKTRNVS